MADDRIDIVIADAIAPTIKPTLDSIGQAALTADASIVKLRNDLASMGVSGFSKLTADATANTAALEKQALAQAKVELANNKTALAAQKLATETARTATASAAAQAAADRLAASQAKQALAAEAAAAAETKAAEAQARAPLRITTAPGLAPAALNEAGALAGAQSTADALAAEGGAVATAAALTKEGEAAQAAKVGLVDAAAASDNLAARADKLMSSVDKNYASQLKWNTTLTEAKALLDAEAISQAEFDTVSAAAATAQSGLGAEVEKVTGKVKVNSLAVKEGVVELREFARGDFSRMASSASILAGSFGLLVPLLVTGAAAFGTIYEAQKTFNDQTEQNSLKDYAESLGLTEKEMRKLSDTTVDANGNIKTHNVLQVTLMDTLKGLWAEIENTVKADYDAITGNQQLTKTFNDLGTIGSEAVTAVEDVVLGLYAVLVSTAKVVVDLSNAMAMFNAGAFSESLTAAKQVGDDITHFGSNVKTVFNEAAAGVHNFYQGWAKESQNAAKARVGAAAQAIIANRNPKKPHQTHDNNSLDPLAAAVNKADEEAQLLQMNDLNKSATAIDQELIKVKDEQMLKQNGTWSAANQKELDELAKKLKANSDEKQVQDQVLALYKQIQGPYDTYNAQVEAANRLHDAGKISLDQYTEALKRADNQLEASTDPYAQIERDLQNQINLTNKYGDALTQLEYKQQLEAQMRAKGKSIYQQTADNGGDITVNGAPKLTADAQDAIDNHNKLLQAQQVQSAVNADPVVQQAIENKKLIAQQTQYNEQIDQLYKDDVLNAQQAEQAKVDFAQKAWDAKNATALNALNTLAQLQNSSNKEIAAIGKAAAVVQATIDGVQAVQKALASAPPPFNFALAAVVGAAAAANVAKIMGFESGGYTGGGGRQEVAGVVHGQEFVVNADATRRNRALLELMNSGGSVGYAMGGYVASASNIRTPANSNVVGIPTAPNGAPSVHNDNRTRIVNVTDPSEIPTAMNSPDGERVILNVLRRNPTFVKSVAGVR